MNIPAAGEFNSCSSFWARSQIHLGSSTEEAHMGGEGRMSLFCLQEGFGRQLVSLKET